MNAPVIATLLPIAVGVALSPAAIVQLILVLLSRRRILNGVVFVISLLLFNAAAMLVGGWGAAAVGERSDAEPSLGVSVVMITLGALLLVIGIRNWRRRHDTSELAVLATISEMGPGAVAVLSFGATFVNPKNLPLLVSAGATVASAAAPLLSGLVFLLVATLPYSATIVYALAGGERAARNLDRARAWLVARNRLIMGVLCIALAIVLVARGAAGLL
ncbi:threonine/homoserine/homoserine lactone efflux protein [Microbacterium sp. AK009]|uniref:GAP family protein n=1 Tax=Microbacterium sp. AK009 TaxID=2723068 RepID=UPI0015CDCCC3|nr:GAP family protein [Microbacterium sp. AK009]NYF17832.1 threonine/homoserine/homoserine lactone efflux protein [Microbacterium sp. AK009]